MARQQSSVKRNPSASSKSTNSKLRSGLAKLGMTYKEYLQSDHWKAVKEKYYRAHKRECWVCGSTRQIDLHHRTYKRLGGEHLRDLVPLCREHHHQFHETHTSGNLDKLTKSFVRSTSREHLPDGVTRLMNGKVQVKLPHKNSKRGKKYKKAFACVESALAAKTAATRITAKRREAVPSVVASTDGPPCRNCSHSMHMMKHGKGWVRPSDKGYYAFWWVCPNDKCKTTLVMPPEGYVRR